MRLSVFDLLLVAFLAIIWIVLPLSIVLHWWYPYGIP